MMVFGSEMRNVPRINIKYDPFNSQDDYKYTGKSFDGTWTDGYIIINKPYGEDSEKSTWEYYICYSYSYDPIEEIKTSRVYPNTIKPLNQVNHIKTLLDDNYVVVLYDNVIQDFAAIYPDADDSWIEELYN